LANFVAMAGAGEWREAREAIVREHMEAENDLDFDRALATFDRPRYELIGTGRVFDGAEAVAGYFRASRRPFPDQRNEVLALHHMDDGVAAEFVLRGTHLGPFPGLDDIPPTGRTFECQMVALFLFEEDRLVCERIYFDTSTIIRQLGAAG
jgi:steroid delta-isomerase-like uncharacterized protein